MAISVCERLIGPTLQDYPEGVVSHSYPEKSYDLYRGFQCHYGYFLNESNHMYVYIYIQTRVYISISTYDDPWGANALTII